VIYLTYYPRSRERPRRNGPIFRAVRTILLISSRGHKTFRHSLFFAADLVSAAIWTKLGGKEWANYAIAVARLFAFAPSSRYLAIAQGKTWQWYELFNRRGKPIFICDQNPLYANVYHGIKAAEFIKVIGNISDPTALPIFCHSFLAGGFTTSLWVYHLDYFFIFQRSPCSRLFEPANRKDGSFTQWTRQADGWCHTDTVSRRIWHRKLDNKGTSINKQENNFARKLHEFIANFFCWRVWLPAAWAWQSDCYCISVFTCLSENADKNLKIRLILRLTLFLLPRKAISSRKGRLRKAKS